MSAAPGNRNAATGAAIRELIALTLSRHGVPAQPRRHLAKISTHLGDAVMPDVEVGGGVWIDTTSRLRHKFSIDLDAARTAADLAGRDVAVLVQWRGGRPPEDAYAVLSLLDLSKLLRAAERTP